MRKAEFYSAVFGIIENEKWEILFQKRQNTCYNDWLFQLPSGHVEWEEFYKDALIREMKEELDITILEDDIDILHVQHIVHKWWLVYFDIYLKINKYSWEIKNNEPEKCSELRFIDLKKYSEDEITHIDIEVLDMIKDWKQISEKLILKNYFTG